MKKECEIVRDLLFCYHDGIASTSTKQLVEEHLENCEECKQALMEIEKDQKIQENQEEIEYLEKINKKMKRKTIITMISIILLILFLISNLYIWISYYNEGNFVNIYLSDNITSEQLENIKQILEEQYEKNKIEYSSKENELNKVKEKFKNKKELLETYQIENPFKAVIKVKTKEKEAKETLQKLEKVEGIANITTNNIKNPYLWFLGKIFKNIQ